MSGSSHHSSAVRQRLSSLPGNSSHLAHREPWPSLPVHICECLETFISVPAVHSRVALESLEEQGLILLTHVCETRAAHLAAYDEMKPKAATLVSVIIGILCVLLCDRVEGIRDAPPLPDLPCPSCRQPMELVRLENPGCHLPILCRTHGRPVRQTCGWPRGPAVYRGCAPCQKVSGRIFQDPCGRRGHHVANHGGSCDSQTDHVVLDLIQHHTQAHGPIGGSGPGLSSS
jgi:hypothetical protein